MQAESQWQLNHDNLCQLLWNEQTARCHSSNSAHKPSSTWPAKRPLEGFSLGPKAWICGAISEISCKNPRPNPSETGMGPLSILKDISLPCRSTHLSPHLVGIRARLQAEGRRIPLACRNTKSWISAGRNKSSSRFLPLLTVNAENKICFVMSLRWALIEFLLILIECRC